MPLLLAGMFVAAVPRGAAGQTVSVPAVREGDGPRVLNEEGRPVGGATVTFLGTDGESGGRTVATATTRPGGTFKIPPRERDATPRSHYPGWSVMVEAPGYGVGGGYLTDERPADVRLHPATELRVKIVGPDGKPAAGVRVAPRMLVARTAPDPRPGWAVSLPADAQARLSARTDADGILVLGGLPRRASVHLAILDDARFAQPDFRQAVPLGNEAVTNANPLRLTPGASVAGRMVYGDTGKPVAGAGVRVQGVSSTETFGFGAAQTDPDGAYRIAGLPPGTYNVLVDLPAALENEWAAPALEAVDVKVGAQLAGKDLKLVKGGVIAGRLVASDTKQGMAGLEIGLHGPARPRSGANVGHTVTAADGSFSFRVPPGAQYVYFMDLAPDGYLRWPQLGKDVEVADGQTVAVTLELKRDPSPPVAGRVFLPDGAPAAGAWVSAELPGEGGLADTRAARASASGRFQFAALPPGSKLSAKRDPLQTAGAVVVKGGEEDVTLRLADKAQAHASLLVTVQDAGGKPVPGAKVQLMVRQGTISIGSNDPAWVTDAKGELLLEKLSTDKEYGLWVEADGFGVGQSPVKALEAGAKNAADTIFLRRADGVIKGRIVTRAGEPMPGASIELNGSETGHKTTKADEQGRFQFKVVAGADPLIFMRNPKGECVGARSVRVGEEVEFVYDPAAVVK